MTKHVDSTTAASNAKPAQPALNLSTVKVGSCVYVWPNVKGLHPDYADAEGMQYVAQVDGDLLTGDTGEKFLRQHIVEHLEGVIVRDDVVTNNNFRDEVLIAMGAELVQLQPYAAGLWRAAQALRAGFDEAVTATERQHPGMQQSQAWKLTSESHPAGRAYDEAVTRFNTEGGNRSYMLTCTINRCRAYTALGTAYKAFALMIEVRDEGGPSEGEHTWEVKRLAELYEDAMDVAMRIDPPRPSGTLAELIDAHRVAVKTFDECVDAEEAAQDALKALHKQNPGMTPGRFRNGKPLMALEVFGTDVAQDVAAIESAHAHWGLEFNLKQVEVVAPRAAKLIRAEIDASLTQCLKVYHEETLPKLQERNAPFVADIGAYHEANDAEEAALDALTYYRPTSMAETAQLARYLNECGRFDAFSTSGKTEQLLATLTTLDAIDYSSQAA